MHPITFFKFIAVGLLSISLTEAASLKKRSTRTNRLRVLSDSESDGINAIEAEVAVTSGVDALVTSSCISNTHFISESDFIRINNIIESGRIEDLRMNLFHRIFELYDDAIPKYARPGSIEWHRVDAINWPEFIDKSDISKWTEEQIDLLNVLIDSGLLGFRSTARGMRNPPKPLVVSVVKEVKEENLDLVNDIEEFSSSAAAANKQAQAQLEPQAKRRIIKREHFVPNAPALKLQPPSSSSESEAVVVRRSARPTKTLKDLSSSSGSSSNSASSYDSGSDSASSYDSSSGSDSESVKAPRTRSAAKKTKKPRTNFIQIRVDSDKPADPAMRDAVVSTVLPIYRKQSGDSTATKIDWDLAIVFYLQKHVLPFSTALKTEGDVLTLERLLKNRYFGFHNKNILNSRRIKVYERLYSLYAAVARGFAHDFHVKWGQIDIKGWPQGITRGYGQWKSDALDTLEVLLDLEVIEFTLKKSFAKKLEEDSKESNSDESSSSSSSSSASSESVSVAPMTPVAAKSGYDSMFGSSSEDEIVVDAPVAKKVQKRAIKVIYHPSDSESETLNANKKAKIEIEKISEAETKPQAEEFVGVTTTQLGEISSRIAEVIATFTSAREKYTADSRHFKIMSGMIKCMNLLLQHTAVPAPAPDQITLIGIEEITEFLNIFRNILATISPNSVSDIELWQKFIIESTKLRARLAGIEYKIVIVNGRRQLNIPKSRISDFKLFGFLCLSEARWINEFQVLESFFDSEDTHIFRRPLNKKN